MREAFAAIPVNAGDAEHGIRRLLIILLGIFAAIYVFLLFRININWDEFNFLAGIYAIQDGRAGARLNNFHTVLYGWLTAIPGMEIDQIIVGRITQLGIFAGSMLLLYLLAREFFSGSISLIVVLLAVTYTDVIGHAFTFRFDPICLFLSLLALYLFQARSGLLTALLAGLALALSFLVSIKTVFYAIPLGAIALHALAASDDTRAQLRRIGVFVAATAFFFMSIYLLRVGVQPGGMPGITGEGQAVLDSIQRAGRKMFLEDGLFPRSHFLIRGVLRNPAHWVLIASGALLALGYLARDSGRYRRAVLMLYFLLPLASGVIYRNSFPYFYVYVLPPALLAAGLAMEFAGAAAQRISERSRQLVLMGLVAFVLVLSARQLFFHYEEGIAKQRRILTAIHEIFPEPVPYIDGYGMVASFPKHGLWMSTWGMDAYHDRGEPVFERVLREAQPKYKLVNHRALRESRYENLIREDRYPGLLPEDTAVLHENFIHHWGPVYVAGKQFEVEDVQGIVEFEILIEGPYTIESDHAVRINGSRMLPGETIHLQQGRNILEAEGPGNVSLRWGRGLKRPTDVPPSDWLFDGL